MIKKIKIKQLRKGMYVHDFNCGWMEHPFIQKQIAITTDEMVKKVNSLKIRDLYIDTVKGLDIGDAYTASEVEKQITNDLEKGVSDTPIGTTHKLVEYEEEVETAMKVKDNAKEQLTKVYKEVMKGKDVRMDEVYPLVNDMVESLSRNESALLSLFRVKHKDEYTFMHSVSVGALLIAFAKSIGITGEELSLYGVGGLMHDIGKMTVPLKILNKPASLNDEEFKKMKNHVVQSRMILSEIGDIPELVIQIAGEHHEREDGRGYPDKKHATEISQGGKMTAIVDVFDAISSDRVYHKGLSPAASIRKIYEWRKNNFFNEGLVDQFIKFMGIYPVGSLVKLEGSLLGVVIESNQVTPIIMLVYNYRRKRAITPRKLDLSQGMGLNNRIVGVEDPRNWGIDVGKVLGIH